MSRGWSGLAHRYEQRVSRGGSRGRLAGVEALLSTLIARFNVVIFNMPGDSNHRVRSFFLALVEQALRGLRISRGCLSRYELP
jgi:hypothetical protein